MQIDKSCALYDSESADEEEPVAQKPYVRPDFLPKEKKPWGKSFGGFGTMSHSAFAFFGPETEKLTVENPLAKERLNLTAGRVYSNNSSFRQAAAQDVNNTSLYHWTTNNTFKTCDIAREKAFGTTEKTRAPKGFVPRSRDITSIREDDERYAQDYATIGYHDENLVVHGVTKINYMDEWENFGFPSALFENIQRARFPRPRLVQRVALPMILDNMDLLLCSETGSGKTAAYLIPIIAMCIQDKIEHKYFYQPYTPFAVIIVPTRELAQQVYEIGLKFTENTGVSVAKIYGEYTVRGNFDELEKGCDILVATPGRLRHFFKDNMVNLKNLAFLVWDEADILLGSSFIEDIEAVVTHENFAKRGCYQTIMLSATITESAIARSTRYLRDKYSASVFTKKCTTNKLCIQEFQRVPKENRDEMLMEFLGMKKFEAGDDPTKFPHILIFVNRQDTCDAVTAFLKQAGYDVTGIQGNHSQDSRFCSYGAFRDKRIPLMVTTDLCARGIDVKGIDLVLNYELPYHLDTYIYRAGRVGRISEGNVMSFVDPKIDTRIIPELLEALTIAQHPVSSVFDELVAEAKNAEMADGFDNFFGDGNNTFAFAF